MLEKEAHSSFIAFVTPQLKSLDPSQEKFKMALEAMMLMYVKFRMVAWDARARSLVPLLSLFMITL